MKIHGRHRRRSAPRTAVIVLAAALLWDMLSSTAAADDTVVLGGGAGIALNGGTLCTLTTIGNDGAGDLVGFTSAHCGGPGAPVAAEGGAGTVGTVVAADDGLDYAVIKFDPAKVTPIPDFDGFAINGIGPNPGGLQMTCHDSRATGHSCAYITGPGGDPATFITHECGNPDDSGAPVTVNDMLVGMVRGGFSPAALLPCPAFVTQVIYPIKDRPQTVLINAILDDVNAKGGPGAGFVPISA
jgi:hypothetical protein